MSERRLIDANALIEQIAVQGQDIDTHDVIDIINAEPTALVVRCGKCKNGVMNDLYNEKFCKGEFHALDWFCADGERKEG